MAAWDAQGGVNGVPNVSYVGGTREEMRATRRAVDVHIVEWRKRRERVKVTRYDE